MQKAYESGIDLHILFIDFGQAFDIIKSITLTKDAEEFGIPAKLIELIKVTTNIKSNSMYAIRYNKWSGNEKESKTWRLLWEKVVLGFRGTIIEKQQK